LTIKLSTPVMIVIAVVVIILFILFPILFYLAVVSGIVYAVWYFGRKKCPSCGARGTISFAGTEVVKTEKAYGLVTRTDTSSAQRRDSSGQVVNESATTHRQERAPIIRTTSRSTYRCFKCGYSYGTDSVAEQEDFSRDDSPAAAQTVIIEREVAKIPCKFCGTLVDPVRDRNCPKCGAKLL
jgi:hypothetical protein